MTAENQAAYRVAVAVPLVVKEGFPPIWYAITLLVYGLTLNTVFARLPRTRRDNLNSE